MFQKIFRLFFFLLILSSLLSSIKCHNKGNLNSTYWNQIKDNQQVFKSWTKLSHYKLDLDQLTSGLSSKLDNLLELTPNISSKCSQSLLTLKKDAQKMKLWAIKGKL